MNGEHMTDQHRASNERVSDKRLAELVSHYTNVDKQHNGWWVAVYWSLRELQERRSAVETSRDADDAWRYRYLKSHLGLGWGVKLAGGDPHGFAGPTLLDKALDAARGAVDDYGCTGCRSTPCICSQLEPSGEEARLWQDQATNFKDQAEYWRLKYEATLPLCGCKSGPCLKQTGVRCALEEPSRLPEPMPERCPCNRADCIKCHPPGLSMAPTAQPPDWYCPNCDCDLCGAVQGRLERSAENGEASQK